MKKESLNYTFQLFLFPGICVLGLIISLIIKKINIMPVFYGLSACLRAFFSFWREIYGKGHWYSKKERILDGIVFIIIGMIGEVAYFTWDEYVGNQENKTEKNEESKDEKK